MDLMILEAFDWGGGGAGGEPPKFYLRSTLGKAIDLHMMHYSEK